MTIMILESVRKRALHEGTTKLAKSLRLSPKDARFTAFLSYRTVDRDVAVGAVDQLRKVVDGFSVYGDFEDSDLPHNVTPATAAKLAKEIRAADMLLVACTEASPTSKWMPWEAGLAQGLGKRVALLLALPYDRVMQDDLFFHGESYYGLYPWLDVHADTDGNQRVWANANGIADCYMEFEQWLRGKEPYARK